ncbi:hypothetical protein EYV94_22995 [Puteibacter caeruleilacunae]|nr:hypothetical protein EYV94_22995 [Puteibacter caeruleilacunae]
MKTKYAQIKLISWFLIISCGVIIIPRLSEYWKAQARSCEYEARSYRRHEKWQVVADYASFKNDGKTYMVYNNVVYDDKNNYGDVCYEIDYDEQIIWELRDTYRGDVVYLEAMKEVFVGDESFVVECYSSARASYDGEAFWMFCTDEHGVLLTKSRLRIKEMTRFRGKKEPIRTIIEEIKKDTVFYNLWCGKMNDIMLSMERKGESLY